MREFDALCLTPVEPLSPPEIRALREREQVSQPVFAHYLNVRKDAISKWERGEKKPDGPSLKLLNLVKAKGLKAIAWAKMIHGPLAPHLALLRAKICLAAITAEFKRPPAPLCKDRLRIVITSMMIGRIIWNTISFRGYEQCSLGGMRNWRRAFAERIGWMI
jgi:putative transcriptional regulator